MPVGKFPSREELARVLDKMCEVGQDIWEVHTYNGEGALEGLEEGDPNTMHDMKAVTRILNGIARGVKPRCLLCPTIFTRHLLPSRFIILRCGLDAMHAAGISEMEIVANAICDACDTDDVHDRMIDYYKRNLLPDLRVFSIHKSSSRA